MTTTRTDSLATRARKSLTGRTLVFLFPILALAATAGAQEPQAAIDGELLGRDGRPLAGVEVELRPDGRRTTTDSSGDFRFEGLEEGRYTLAFAVAGEEPVREVRVERGRRADLEVTLDETASFAESLVVRAASRRPERLIDAPAAVSLVTAETVELEGLGGQVPALLASTVGAEAVQNGLYDYNFNVRGFNGFLNRRVQTIVDGRDPSITDTSGQEWFSMITLTDDLESAELVRGPSAALYGANSVNGVLNLVTKAPRDSQGGHLRLALGELDTAKVDFRWAGELADGWYFKAVANRTQSKTFTRSRHAGTEYDGLPPEAVPLPDDDLRFGSARLRLDRYLDEERLLTVEGGISEARGEVFMTPAQRAFVLDSPPAVWGRFHYDTPHWRVFGSYADRASEALAMAAGFVIHTSSYQYDLELQGNQELLAGRLHLVGGLAYGDEEVDSRDPDGRQTLYTDVIGAERHAAYVQADYSLTDQLSAVAALRWDDSSLHPEQLTPKLSLGWAPHPDHSLRAGYNEGFQVGNYAELFLEVPAGPPLDLSAVLGQLPPLPPGIDLGLAAVPILDLGNPFLDVEKVETYELGYRGILGRNLLVNVDLYRSKLRDFIGSVPPGADPRIAPWSPPPGVPPELAGQLAAILNGAVPGLTNRPDGGAMVALSRLNTGEIDGRGLEVALSYSPSTPWLFEANGSWFDHEVHEQVLGPLPITPNRPDYQGSLRVAYQHGDLSTSVRYRWSEAFHWSSGLWIGDVPAYEVLDLSAYYDVNRRLRVGIDVTNALDDEHYQAFGADLIGRRALGYVAVGW